MAEVSEADVEATLRVLDTIERAHTRLQQGPSLLEAFPGGGPVKLPSARYWLFSTKAFTAAMLALYVALAMDLPRPYWAMTTVYVVSHPLTGATTSKALYRMLGTLIGATGAVVLVPTFVSAPELLSIAVAA